MNAPAIFDAVIHDCRPSSLLVCGDAARTAANRWQASQPDVSVDLLEPDQQELKGNSARPHDLALVSGTLESLDQATGTLLLGQLRNLGNHQIAVLVDPASGWNLKDFIALGFTRHSSADGAEELTLYTYNINSYNHKRAWNNPKYWANPEMWGKARW